MTEYLAGAWFAVETWAWGWKVAAFLVTWVVAGVLWGTITCRAGSAWGADDEQPK